MSTQPTLTGSPGTACYLRLSDIDRLGSSRFRYDNWVRSKQAGTPVFRDTPSGTITVERPFELVGWCDKMPSELMHGREGQIGLMLWHPELEDVWQHYPLFESDGRAAATFVSR